MESLSQLLNVTLNDKNFPNNALNKMSGGLANYYIVDDYVDLDRYVRFIDKTDIRFFNLVVVSDNMESGKLSKIGIHGMRQEILFDADYDHDTKTYLINSKKVEVVCNRWCVFGWCKTREDVSPRIK